MGFTAVLNAQFDFYLGFGFFKESSGTVPIRRTISYIQK